VGAQRGLSVVAGDDGEPIHYSQGPFDPDVETRKVEAARPSLEGTAYCISSRSTDRYNCVAWAAGDDTRFWAPAPGPGGKQLGGYYWPPDPRIPALFTVGALEQVFAARGYSRCENGDVTPGIEKVAIFGYDEHDATHMARQTRDGKWTSKMGALADIIHEELNGIAGGTVGQIQRFMSRPRAEDPDRHAEPAEPTIVTVSGSGGKRLRSDD
jgi:hypothetical protein